MAKRNKAPKDALDTLGMPLTSDVGSRDAVHVAVLAVEVVDVYASAGDHVGIELSERGFIASYTFKPHIAVIDPFINNYTIRSGTRVWAMLYPRTITSLAHHWTHPNIPNEDKLSGKDLKKASEIWLREHFAKSSTPPYEVMLRVLHKVAEGELRGQITRGEMCAEPGELPLSDPEEYDDYYSYSLENDYFHFNGYDAHGRIPEGFWDHVERVIGKPIPEEVKRKEYYSCSC